jgi:hypothetical protein
VIGAECAQIARETRQSVARTDALLARLRCTEDLIIGRSDAEIRASSIVAHRVACSRAAELEVILARMFREVAPIIREMKHR